MPFNPFFFATSSEKPKIINISFQSDPKASLGAQLSNHDKGLDNDMFMPSYTRVGRLIDGETVARKAGVKIGDILVTVNGEGFRRFPPDFDDNELEDVTLEMKADNVDLNHEEAKKSKAKTITGLKVGEHYDKTLRKIKEIKQAGDSSDALHLSFERYDWDSRVNSWPRFLLARGGNIPDAMKMMQDHESWKASTFPIDLTDPGIQTVLKKKAVSEIPSLKDGFHPTVYVDILKLQSISNCTSIDVARAFLIFTESMMKNAIDPRAPKCCQLIDLSGVSITSGLRSDILREVYGVFEPNYPETLHKMILYPVSKLAASTAKLLLSFVNEKTKTKFLFTDEISVVCKELGWNREEIQSHEQLSDFARRRCTSTSTMVFE